MNGPHNTDNDPHVDEGGALDPRAAAQMIEQTALRARRQFETASPLAAVLVNRLTGKRATIMYEVATRDIPARRVLCLKRNVDEQAAWAFGKEFMAILRDRRLPRLTGPEGAVYCIFWGEVSTDSDGPVEWCRPIPDAEADMLASQYPDLTLRTEPAHREAFVALPRDPANDAASVQLASEALQDWAADNGINPIPTADLGVRITFLFRPPDAAETFPDRHFAIPFA
jgi:hypothetical protein